MLSFNLKPEVSQSDAGEHMPELVPFTHKALYNLTENASMMIGDLVVLTTDVLVPMTLATTCLVLGIIIFSVGILGNTVLIISVVLSRKLRRPYNMFIVSFALSDLTILLAVGIFQLDIYRTRRWDYDARMCLYLSTMLSSELLMSGMHIFVISLYRYVTVVHPQLRYCINHKVTVASMVLAIYCITFTLFPLPRMLQLHLLRDQLIDNLYFDTRAMMCIYKVHYRRNLMCLFGFIILGTVCLIYFYLRIHCLVRTNQKRMRGRSSSFLDRTRKDIRILKTMCVIFVMYVGSQIPLPVLLYMDKDKQLSHFYFAPWVVFLWLSSSTNWVIYGLMNRDFRSAYGRLVGWNRKGPYKLAPGRRQTLATSVLEKPFMENTESSSRIRKSF